MVFAEFRDDYIRKGRVITPLSEPIIPEISGRIETPEMILGKRALDAFLNCIGDACRIEEGARAVAQWYDASGITLSLFSMFPGNRQMEAVRVNSCYNGVNGVQLYVGAYPSDIDGKDFYDKTARSKVTYLVSEMERLLGREHKL